MNSAFQNIGAYIGVPYAGGHDSIVAAGTGDNTLVDGATIDRSAFQMPVSAKVWFNVEANMANTQTLSLAVTVQHAPDGSTWSTFATLANAVVLTSAGSAQTAILGKMDLDLSGAERYIRVNFTPDLSASGTDTATLTPVVVFGGEDLAPAV